MDNIRTVKKLIELIENTSIGEIEIQEGDNSIRVSRQTTNFQPTAQPSATYHSVAPPPLVNQNDNEPLSPPIETKGHKVTSPMVGTAYLAATPDAKSFVEIGQHVEAGQVLCIIEAMKMFNQIEADKPGIIVARLIENGQPVEFDQPLFIIE